MNISCYLSLRGSLYLSLLYSLGISVLAPDFFEDGKLRFVTGDIPAIRPPISRMVSAMEESTVRDNAPILIGYL